MSYDIVPIEHSIKVYYLIFVFLEKITSFQLLTLANIATQSISLIAFWKGRLAISQLVKPNLKDLQLMNNIIPT